jgi:heme-degrading monooxygenase HmoA
MYARVMTGRLQSADRQTFETMIRDQVIPRASKLRGFKGGYWLRDLDSDQVLGVTLFESEEALRASEEQANRIREEASREAGIPVPQFHSYEVVASVAEGSESQKKAA